MTGRTIAHYRVSEKLGEGGMGIVYRAHDTRLNRPVALKVLAGEAVANPERKRRFIREAQAASALNHPHIVTIHDIGTADLEDQPVDFIAMEYVDGKTLDQLIGGKPLAMSEALKYGAQIADALAAAHAAGIIHRDLKPGNIMVTGGGSTRSGQIKVLDFGLAKLVEPAEAISQSDALEATLTITPEAPRTEEGVVVGTVSYMSPEQAQGKRLDARSDIFSFGSVLYEMVTGRRPFHADNKLATLSAILTQEPKLISELLPHPPPDLEKVISRCLRKDPDRRFHHMMDVKVALEELREESGSGRTVLPARRRRAAAWAIPLAALLVIAAAAVAWRMLRQPAGTVAPVLTQLTFDSGLTTDPAFSPDSKLVAFASDRATGGNLDIWLQQLATGQAVRLTQDPAEESEPSFSPDGSRIAFRMERAGGLGGIYVISTIGGEPRLIANQGRRPRFSPDGTQVAYWVGDWYMGRIFVAPVAGGDPAPIQPGFASAEYPVWSPDGKQLLFLGARTFQDLPADRFDWWITPVAGGEPASTGTLAILRREKLIVRWPSIVAPGDWKDDGVFFSAKVGATTNLWRIPVSSQTRKAGGTAERLTLGTALETKPSLSAAGAIVFANLSAQLNIWSLPIDADRGKSKGELHKLTNAAFDAQADLSADGKKLVFASTRTGNSDIWLKDLVTGKETPLTASPEVEEQPGITRDGKTVFYMTKEGERVLIHAIPAGGGVPETLCDHCERPWDWSPDGRKILFISNPTGRLALALLDVQSRQKRDLVAHPRYELARARFSPDGRWIGFIAPEGATFGKTRVAVIPFRPDGSVTDSDWIWVAENEAFHDKVRWSPDGNLVYYTSDRDGYRCIRAQRLDPATKHRVGEPFDVYHSHSPRRSLKNAGIELMEISVGPDKLVFNLGEVTGNIWMAKFSAPN